MWNTLDFVLNGLVFVLIGLQLPHILAGIRNLNLPTLLLYGALLTMMLITLRLTWALAESWISRAIRRLVKSSAPAPSMKEAFIVGWAGMRGVIALAAAFSLPEVLNEGSAFPQRDVLTFLTFCVILVTPVAQGLSLPLLIRKLGMAATAAPNYEKNEARRRMLSAAINHIRDLRSRDNPADEEALADLLHHYQQRLEQAESTSVARTPDASNYEQYHVLSGQLRAAERSVILHLRDQNTISDEVLRTLERELGLMDVRFLSSHP